MSYVVNKRKSNGKFVVIKEKQTGVDIFIKREHNIDPYAIARKLNLGSGFNGFTPPFFARHLSYK